MVVFSSNTAGTHHEKPSNLQIGKNLVGTIFVKRDFAGNQNLKKKEHEIAQHDKNTLNIKKGKRRFQEMCLLVHTTFVLEAKIEKDKTLFICSDICCLYIGQNIC